MENKVQTNDSGLMSNGCQEQRSEIDPVEVGTVPKEG